MLGLGKTGAAGVSAAASLTRRQAIYQRHASALCRQALLMLDNERGALGLVLCGGLGYVQAGTVLGIGPQDMAALLRTTMRRLASSPAAGDGDQG